MTRNVTPADLETLRDDFSHAIIFECVAGSRAYGTARPDSDEDIRGIFVLPTETYLTVGEPIKQISDQRHDITYYSLKRLMELAATANPNIIELLFMPDDCIRRSTPVMERLLAARDLFITRAAYKSHIGYAESQIKRARGQNKWVNNPQPEAPPRKEDFCWIVPQRSTGEDLPYRPIRLVETDVDLAACHCASLEHVKDVFRLYHYGSAAKGVFREGMLVCESISLGDERQRCIGLLIYNRSGYEKSMRDHRNYWTWRRERNESRWIDQERGQVDYDAKNMMHSVRLLLSGEDIFREGRPLVRFVGERLDLLRSILAGEYSYEFLIDLVETKVAELAELVEKSSLPEKVDQMVVDRLLRELTEIWEKNHA